VVQSSLFEICSTAVILGNTGLMTLAYFGMSSQYARILNIASIVFFAAFCGEIAVKLSALRASFFSDRWNIFDFSVLLGSGLFRLMFSLAGNTGIGGTFGIALRTFRLARILRLVQRAKVLFRNQYQLSNIISCFVPGPAGYFGYSIFHCDRHDERDSPRFSYFVHLCGYGHATIRKGTVGLHCFFHPGKKNIFSLFIHESLLTNCCPEFFLHRFSSMVT
jgi:phage shock protein PspC (stress-responsive transcriptional regulator)